MLTFQTGWQPNLFPGIFGRQGKSGQVTQRREPFGLRACANGGEYMSNYIEKNLDHDGVDRRGFLKCMAWAGTGTLCVLQGGVLKSFALSDVLQQKIGNMKGDLSFVRISDSHIGFNKDANPDVTATLREAIAKVNALPTPPSFVLHTGVLTQLSKPEEFDTLAESLKSLKTGHIFYVPGEHDVL